MRNLLDMSHQHEGDQLQKSKPESKAKSGIKYWVDPRELSHDPSRPVPAVGEFASAPTAENADASDGHSRREFLQIMGASLAMVGASACARRPIEKIVPYLKKPEEVTPGIANWYASTCGECDSGCGILVKSREGRPIKFEGNPHHPTNQGGLCARGQASVLNLYDPDRARTALEVGRKGGDASVTWEALDAKVLAKLQTIRANGGKVRVLTGEVSSPSTNKLIAEFLAGFSGGKRVVYEPMGADEVAVASELSYGTRVVPHYHFDKADIVVSFGADFLGTWLSPVEFSKGYSKKRKVGVNAVKAHGKTMSRFVAFESIMTLTGTNADDRFRLKSGDEHKAAMALAYELIVAQGHSRFAGDSAVKAALVPYSPASIAQQLDIPAEVFKKTAQELWENRGRGIVVGGGQSVKGDAGVALEVAVNLLNSALENDGATIDGTGSPATDRSSYADLTKLIEDMKAGQVDALLIYKSNPLFTLPKSLGFEEAAAKVGLVLAFASSVDETVTAADYLCTTPHHTEAWGDASPYIGVHSIQQPTIAPLYQTRGLEDSLMTWAKQLKLAGAITAQPNWHEYLKNNWKETVYREAGGSTPFPLFWESILREGFSGTGKSAGSARSFSAGGLKAVPSPAWNKDKLTLALYPKISQLDGRVANNSWLQELPDPVTKITWDNYASISAARAARLGVEEGDVVKVTSAQGSIEVPAHVQPGMHDESVAVALGYGRRNAGRVGTGIGTDAFPLAAKGTRALAMSGLIVTVEKTGKRYQLAATQHHNNIEGRTAVVKEATLKEYKHDSKAGNESEGEPASMWERHSYPGYRWGMAIDLNSCTGCSACVIGCQSENNIPTVGKKMVLDSKEMHWLRIDRYYSGEKVEDPDTMHQPMLCQHCENAPCETVCPVLATMHDHEGLNQQVYNRCVGTRYCANNCPYKVRRFNWFTFTDEDSVPAPLNLAYNPDLTVRTRGVMEKCTFCFQRIREVKDRAKDTGSLVHDGELKTACQQSCPTDAIIFGNINDKNSRVSQIAADARGFTVLEELNTRPSITYLTKIRNNET